MQDVTSQGKKSMKCYFANITVHADMELCW